LLDVVPDGATLVPTATDTPAHGVATRPRPGMTNTPILGGAPVSALQEKVYIPVVRR
jgi:hypothetical protein